jgi:hypothetical protein
MYIRAGQEKCAAECRDCKNERQRRHHAENLEESRAKTREHTRAYMSRNRELVAERRRERYAMMDRQESLAQERQERQRNPLRTKAKNAVRTAVQQGVFPPAAGLVCEDCQEALAQQYHHHLGYEPQHWLDIVALCTECHGRAHWI